eukprot:1066594-Prymnesium_polylepis.1
MAPAARARRASRAARGAHAPRAEQVSKVGVLLDHAVLLELEDVDERVAHLQLPLLLLAHLRAAHTAATGV